MEQINFSAKLVTNDLSTMQDTINTELLQRLKLVIGSYRSAGARYGIVSETNPVGVDTTSLPFAVISSSTELKVNVSSGIIVTNDGEIAISSDSTDLALADDTEGVVNLVIAEYKLIDSDPRPATFEESIIYAQKTLDTVVKVITLSNYNNISVFPLTRKNNSVVLAAVQVYKNENQDLKLNIDTTQTIYSFIRPWFSPIDIEHRSKTGTGSITEKNPHGLSFADLSTGNLSIYSQLLSHGVIVSRDDCVKNVAGCSFTETFETTSIFEDTTGINSKEFFPSNIVSSVFKVYNHNYIRNQRIRFATSGALPSPLSALTDYYVRNATKDTFEISTTPNGAQLTINSTGSGVHRVFSPDFKYVKLQHYPLQIAAMYLTETPQNKIAGHIVPGKNMIGFSQYENITSQITVMYHYSKASELQANIYNNSLVFTQPTETDALIAGGKEFLTLTSPTLNFENSGPIAKTFDVLIDGNGDFIKNPTVVLSSLKLDTLTSPYYFGTTLYANANIMIGLTLANTGAAITLRLIGKDELGATATEDLIFDNTWLDNAAPSVYEEPKQFKISTTTFSTIQAIELVSRTGDGNASSITIYADYSGVLCEALLTCSLFWDGYAIKNVKDKRCVIPSLTYKEPPIDNLLNAAYLLNAADSLLYPISIFTELLFKEDFEFPKFIDSTPVASSAVKPKGSIKIDIVKLQVGDNVTVAPGKVLTFVSTLINGPTFGEVLLVASDEVNTRLNLVNTINNVTFNSGVIATNDTTNLITNLTASTLDFNFELLKSESVSGALTLNGFNNGFLKELPILKSRFSIGLNGKQPIPTPEDVAIKYRTLPFTVNTDGITKLAVICSGLQELYNVFAKPTYQNTTSYDGGSRPEVWQQKITATPTNNPNVLVLEFPQPIAKVSFEIFGKLRGISVYIIN